MVQGKQEKPMLFLQLTILIEKIRSIPRGNIAKKVNHELAQPRS
jgi:hypothetical protein